MGPVCFTGAADMNRALKCISVTRQPVINANKMKGPLSKETNTDMVGVGSKKQNKKKEKKAISMSY